MSKVPRKIIPAIKIAGVTYQSAHGACQAFADEIAVKMDGRYETRMAQIYHEDDPFWETVDSGIYDIAYDKAYRRAKPIFAKFFKQGEESC